MLSLNAEPLTLMCSSGADKTSQKMITAKVGPESDHLYLTNGYDKETL